MVKIRLNRMGRRHQAFYRIVVVDSKEKRSGRYIQSLGYYNPLNENDMYKLDGDLALEWLMKGAQPTVTAKDILSKMGVMKKFDQVKYENKKSAGEAK
ncbi:MAG: 30S ribosomal protein S16 [Thermotogae bacterium]|nr:30S ribosomal protein S16 [Thermotogota bacterium]MCP5465819.1 30S ribosomal protein S16 [Thermotogota bacterium]HOO74950.1 30S ribosomal protein S16 [Tepiditoga sp.]